MKQQVDKSCQEMTFQIDESVYVKLRPYQQSLLRCRPNEKLTPRFFGPFSILERIGNIAHKLDLPDTFSLHPVFHIA